MAHPNGYNPNTLTFRDQSDDRPSRYILVGLGNWPGHCQRVWAAMDGRSGAIIDTRINHDDAEALVAALNECRALAAAELREQEDAANGAGTPPPLATRSFGHVN